MFRFAVLIATTLLITGPDAQADEMMVKKLKHLKKCPGCDLAGADLSGAYLKMVNVIKADLRGANLSGV